MATKVKRTNYDSFEKGSHRTRSGGGSYTQRVSNAAAHKRNDEKMDLIADILFCLLLPPYGLYRIWTKEHKFIFVKPAGTIVAALMMILWFSVIIPDEQPEPIDVVSAKSAAVEVYSNAD